MDREAVAADVEAEPRCSANEIDPAGHHDQSAISDDEPVQRWITRLALVPITVAAFALTACGSNSPGTTATSGNAPAASSSPGVPVDPHPPDGTDAEFVAVLRAAGLIPAPGVMPSDSVYVTDANAVCDAITAVPGQSQQVIATDLVNMRQNRVAAYNITENQGTEVMIVSAKEYCPARVSVVKAALN